MRLLGLGLWGCGVFFSLRDARNVRFASLSSWQMKRSRSSLALGGDGYELRNSKVCRKNYFGKEEIAMLDQHDILNIIFGFIRKIGYAKDWKEGRVLIMESRYDDGHLYYRDTYYNKQYANSVFLHWHSFLSTVLRKKEEEGNRNLTIQKCTYWSKSRDATHSWESFHRCNFHLESTDERWPDEMDFHEVNN